MTDNAERTLTTYVILRRLNAAREHRGQALAVSDPNLSVSGAAAGKMIAEAWTPVAVVEASSAANAARAHADADGALEEGAHEFRAVPRRSWPAETFTFTIRTTRVVESAARREESEVRVPA